MIARNRGTTACVCFDLHSSFMPVGAASRSSFAGAIRIWKRVGDRPLTPATRLWPALCSLENTKTGVALETKTDSNGYYEFVNVYLGSYRVWVVAPGFQTSSTDSFDLAVNGRQRVALTLQVGQTSQNITVSDAATQLETENSSRGKLSTQSR